MRQKQARHQLHRRRRKLHEYLIRRRLYPPRPRRSAPVLVALALGLLAGLAMLIGG